MESDSLDVNPTILRPGRISSARLTRRRRSATVKFSQAAHLKQLQKRESTRYCCEYYYRFTEIYGFA